MTNRFFNLSITQCQQARLARDSRFDGHFFIAVKTTGIFCRPICPATAPKEENVEYFGKSAQAIQAGYRPCLRCRPDSAPNSWPWLGVETTFQRAIQLIENGELNSTKLPDLCERLGISERYLRQLFQRHLGLPPKKYALYQQVMFAKQLLHNSQLQIQDIAFACGFNSIRRFNDAFVKTFQLTPNKMRKNSTDSAHQSTLSLSFRPPFNWVHLLNFYRLRALEGIEEVGEHYYQRTFQTDQAKGWFKISMGKNNTLNVEFEISDIKQLHALVVNIRRIFDLDADIQVIEEHLSKANLPIPPMQSGIRTPGVWNTWEAGIRAIFGQQISVKAAIQQLNSFVKQFNPHNKISAQFYFPTPLQVASTDLSVLKMPQSRKNTIKNFANYMIDHGHEHPNTWLAIKGIGPWTIEYAKLRGLSDPNCFLNTDLVIKKVLEKLPLFNEKTVAPWGSYATFHCWNTEC